TLPGGAAADPARMGDARGLLRTLLLVPRDHERAAPGLRRSLARRLLSDDPSGSLDPGHACRLRPRVLEGEGDAELAVSVRPPGRPLPPREPHLRRRVSRAHLRRRALPGLRGGADG